MIEPRKQAYLEAMGFDVWVARPAAPEPDRLVVGPGQGSTLLVCANPEQSASKLGADIVRAIGGDPAWAWPDPEGTPDSPRLEDAVRDNLFTRVIVFGAGTSERLSGRTMPSIIASATVSVVTDMDELATRGIAKQEFWKLLKYDLPDTGITPAS
jgi:hypothetical protein